jgi:hypothetical protein
VLVDDDVAEIDADAELDAALFRDAAIAQRQLALQLDRAAHRIDDARELDQEAVAGGLDDAPRCSAIFGSDTSRRNAVKAACVPSSSSPISREYPATSAARIAASRRSTRCREVMVYKLPQQGPSFSFLLGRDCQWRYLYRLMRKGEVPV